MKSQELLQLQLSHALLYLLRYRNVVHLVVAPPRPGFYIGDGLTGNGTGTVQQFFVLSGTGTLYLGISDAGFYNGAPGAYGDNAGFYTVNFDVAGANSGGGGTTSPPEPSSLMLIGTGLLGLVSLRRKVLGR